jgi:iron complex outermembrane receptor protein
LPLHIRSFFLLLIIGFAYPAMSQSHRVELRLNQAESNGHPSVLCVHVPDSVVLFNGMLKKNRFLETRLGESYRLKATHLGVTILDTVFQVTDQLMHLNVTVPTSISSMKTVVVVSKKPLIKEEDDKTIVDATVLSESSTNAFEVLEKTPGAIIDQDGNIYLNSTTPASVFINGRAMKLSAADISSLLKSLPANSVQKIEILRTPSAKFDAASSGGIVNIVLRKGVRLGRGGSVNIGYFQGVYATQTAGFTMNNSAGQSNTYLSYQYTNRTNFEEIISERYFQSDSTRFKQSSFTRYPGTTHYAAIGTDFALRPQWNLSLDLRYTGTKNNSEAENNIDVLRGFNNSSLGNTRSVSNNDNYSHFLAQTAQLKYKLDSLGSEWTTQLEYSFYRYSNDQQYTNRSTLVNGPSTAGTGDLLTKKNIVSIQSDLVWKLPRKFTLELGVKSGITGSQNNAAFLIDTGNNVYITDRFQTNRYRFQEQIHAAYVQGSRTFGKWVIKPGVRFEITDMEGRQTIPGDTSFFIRRTDFFPYIYIKHPILKMYGQTLMGSLIFRKSIRRPYYESLNPFPRFIDPFLFEVGNPNLKPQFTTNAEFNVTFNDIPVVAAGINRTRSIFNGVVYQDDVTKIAYRTFDNLGENDEVYFRLITGIPPGKRYFFYLGGIYNHTRYDGFFQNRPFQFRQGTFTLFTYHEYKVTKKFTASMQGFFRSKAIQNLYTLDDFGGMFISFNHALWNRKANLIISCSDVFRTNRADFRFDQNNQQVSGTRINDTRRLGITLRYNVGFKPKEEKKPGFDQPSETKD